MLPPLTGRGPASRNRPPEARKWARPHAPNPARSVLHSSNGSSPAYSSHPPQSAPVTARTGLRRGVDGLSERGTLFVMTGASGVGKDTIRNATLPSIEGLYYSISATTRPRRPGEMHGLQYYFYERDEFERMIEDDELLEYAEYVGDYYGTPALPVLERLEAGQDVLLELELVGARKVKERLSEAVMVFIAPPSLNELERRLRGRGTDSEEKIQKRLRRARAEIQAVREFDYVVVNDDLEEAAATFAAIIHAERARASRLSDEEIAGFLRES